MPGYLLIEGEPHLVALIADGDGGYRLSRDAPAPAADVTVARDGDRIWIHLDGQVYELVWQDAVTRGGLEAAGDGADEARAPMPGTVVQVAVTAGDEVREGETMMIIESMKLETAIKAPRDGVIETVHVGLGQTFQRDAVLVTLSA